MIEALARLRDAFASLRVVLISLMLAFSLAACGGEYQDDDYDDDRNYSQECGGDDEYDD